MDYKSELLDGRWQRRRLEILKRDGYACVKCKKTGYLQVHHKTYKGKPWESPSEDLISLCDECHKKEHTRTTQPPTIEELQSQIDKAEYRLKNEDLSDSAKYSLTIALGIFKSEYDKLTNG